MFQINKNHIRRNKILKVEFEGNQDIAHFKDLHVGVLRQLLNNDFINPDAQQNNSPTTMGFFNFMMKYPEYRAHGMAFHIRRWDYGIIIEGLRGLPSSEQSKLDFFKMFRKADDCYQDDDGYMYSWYD